MEIFEKNSKNIWKNMEISENLENIKNMVNGQEMQENKLNIQNIKRY